MSMPCLGLVRIWHEASVLAGATLLTFAAPFVDVRFLGTSLTFMMVGISAFRLLGLGMETAVLTLSDC